MNRRIKLITSFAAVCIAFTMMCFGVYAAATPAITVTGSVSFTATNVLCTTSGVKGTGAANTWATALTGGKTYTAGTAAASTIAVGTIDLTDATLVGGYKISITSNFAAGSATKLKITSTLPETITGTGYTVTFVGDTNWTTASGTTGLGGGQTATVTVTVTFNAASAGASATQDIGMSIALARAN